MAVRRARLPARRALRAPRARPLISVRRLAKLLILQKPSARKNFLAPPQPSALVATAATTKRIVGATAIVARSSLARCSLPSLAGWVVFSTKSQAPTARPLPSMSAADTRRLIPTAKALALKVQALAAPPGANRLIPAAIPPQAVAVRAPAAPAAMVVMTAPAAYHAAGATGQPARLSRSRIKQRGRNGHRSR